MKETEKPVSLNQKTFKFNQLENKEKVKPKSSQNKNNNGNAY